MQLLPKPVIVFWNNFHSFGTLLSQEFYKNDKDIVIDGDMKHTVYIYKCDNCTIRVNNKVNSITMGKSAMTSHISREVIVTLSGNRQDTEPTEAMASVPLVMALVPLKCSSKIHNFLI